MNRYFGSNVESLIQEEKATLVKKIIFQLRSEMVLKMLIECDTADFDDEAINYVSRELFVDERIVDHKFRNQYAAATIWLFLKYVPELNPPILVGDIKKSILSIFRKYT